jgi:uncharacterized protein
VHHGLDARGPMHDARETVRRMLLPCSIVALTTTMGLASLFISALRPARHLAVLVIAGVLLALVLGITAIPGLARLAARATPISHEAGSFSRGLTRLGRFTGESMTRPLAGVLVFTLLICVCLLKVPFALKNFEADFVKNFREGSNVRRVYQFVQNNLGPVGSIEVLVRRKDGGPILGETAMQAMQSARESRGIGKLDEAGKQEQQRHMLANIRRQLSLGTYRETVGMALMLAVDEFQGNVEEKLNPPVLKTLSLVDIVKYASVGRLLGVPLLELPRFEWQFALTMVLIDQQVPPDLMRHFLSADGKAMRVNLRALESDDVYNKLAVSRRVREMATNLLGPEFDVEVTGLYPLYAKIASELLRDQLRTFILALILITTCMCVALWSIRLGLLSMIPNLMPMILCLGVMGWAEIPINMATAMMLSVALGIAVDNTIHYLCRFRRELNATQDYLEAIVNTHRTVGRACVFNGVVLVSGFWVLCLSQFVPTVYFGMLIGLTMIGALIGDMIFLPMLLTLLRPIRVQKYGV